ncbi:MAG: GAF domain-containing sensor histidine kinase [Microthrixaceae bacterium]
MGRQLEDVAEAVAALARATSSALDPSSILTRTVTVLAPLVDLGRAPLWREHGDELVLTASYPSALRDLPAPTFDEAAAEPGALSLPLEGRAHPIGRLVAHSATGAPFDAADHALLELAALQIAGALERAQLFGEVMELERLKSDFISRVSHELRTPITIINGFLETLIAHESRLDGEQRLHMLERSRAAAARLADLIEELLILSRIEGGVLTPQPEVILVADLLESVRAAAVEPDQVLVEAPSSESLVADRSLLVRALGLLVDNAVKYGGAAEVAARAHGPGWVIEVRDRGPGFPDDIRATAFEMFTRSQTNASVPGLGVGLAIARTLVEVLDGTVEIDEAHAGPGALVRVRLPT